MSITSLRFLGFFLVVFFAHWLLFPRKRQWRGWVLLVASYLFYGLAEWRMLPLLVAATAVFYLLGIAIGRNPESRKATVLKTLGVVLGVGALLYFKYFNFFAQSFSALFNAIGLHTNWSTFNIIMPLGVSYFTFKLISYVMEVYHGKMAPCRDLLAFANYVAFFPTIMSGPIDRPNRFIPQLQTKQPFDFYTAFDGFQQVLWGLFKKTVIADRTAMAIGKLTDGIDDPTGSTLLVKMVLYVFQMYADFSGYSDMAIGMSKTLGLRVAPNFRAPFFATNVAEFWRRWHMSLTSWVTDYVFTPLNIKFRNWGNWGTFLAVLINMVIIGLWHGANWTYAVFGVWQALFFIPLIFSGKIGKKQKLKINKLGLPSLKNVLGMLGVFLVYAIGTVFFTAPNVGAAFHTLGAMCNTSLFTMPRFIGLLVPLMCALLVAIEWLRREKEHPLSFSSSTVDHRAGLIMALDVVIMLFIFVLGNTASTTFIYYQF
ncbi:MAG: MBOAT family protein [Bacteroidales bacterium]|nr:MBOAT family protein [Bacteroidales bacterium]